MKKKLQHKVASNIFSLTFAKGIDVLIPLLLIPFLVHKLGVESYGVFATCLVTLNFLMRFTDFGINITTSKNIAITNNTKAALDILVNSLQAKLFLLAPALIIYYLISLSYSETYFDVSLCLSIALICDTFSPLNYYQGLQRLRYYAFVCLIWRWISALSVLLFVRSKDDLLLYCLLHSLSYFGILVNLFIPLVSKHRKDLTFKWRFKKTKEVLKDGWQVFSFSLISSLFVPIITNYIAITSNAGMVTIFNVTQRIFSSAYRFFEPINTAVFPYLSNLHSSDIRAYVNRSKLILYFFLMASFCFLILLLVLHEPILHLFIGVTNSASIWIYFISGITLVSNVMNLYISHILIIIGKAKDIKKIVVLAFSILFIALCISYITKANVIYIVIINTIPSYVTFLLCGKIYYSEMYKVKIQQK